MGRKNRNAQDSTIIADYPSWEDMLMSELDESEAHVAAVMADERNYGRQGWDEDHDA